MFPYLFLFRFSFGFVLFLLKCDVGHMSCGASSDHHFAAPHAVLPRMTAPRDMMEWTMSRAGLGGPATWRTRGLMQTRVRIEVHAQRDNMTSPWRIPAFHLYGDTHVMNMEGIPCRHDGRAVVSQGLICPGDYPAFDEELRSVLVQLLVRVGMGQNDLRLDVFCRQGRHRSMIFGWTLGRIAASMGFEITMAIPTERDHRGRRRLCGDYTCHLCHTLGSNPPPPLSASEEAFISWLTQTFMRTDGDWNTLCILAIVIEEWDYGPWGD